MSRISLLEKLKLKRKSILEFDYDNLKAPPIRALFNQQDLDALYYIATSIKYSAKINKKYKMIDQIMRARGFIKANSGTNRVVYNFLEDKSFVAKVAIDRVGLEDSPREFRNQEYFKPFCTKIFEVEERGVISFVERVNPITSLEEFESVKDDIFNLMITKILGKYVVDDLGVEKFMNYGLRYNCNGYTFGPVILDFPYVYLLDGNKLLCNKIDPLTNNYCGGEIDYDDGLSHLVCKKCGATYSARDLSQDDKNIIISKNMEELFMRAQIINSKNGEVIYDSGRESDRLITKDEYYNCDTNKEKEVVSRTVFNRYNRLNPEMDYEKRMAEANAQVIEQEQKAASLASQDRYSMNNIVTKSSNEIDTTITAYTAEKQVVVENEANDIVIETKAEVLETEEVKQPEILEDTNNVQQTPTIESNNEIYLSQPWKQERAQRRNNNNKKKKHRKYKNMDNY